MFKSSLQQSIIISAALLLVIVCMISYFVIFPTVRDIFTLRQTIWDTNQYMKEQYQRTKQMRRSLNEIDSVLTSVHTFMTSIIPRGDELHIITQLEDVALKNNIEQKLSVKFSEEESKSKSQTKDKTLNVSLPYYTFHFSIKGTYSNILNYLKSLESFPYYFVINNIKIEKPSGRGVDPNNNILTGTFYGNVYAQ